MVDDGRCVPLVPNYQANVMTEAGQFKTKNINDIGILTNCNQDLKDSYGVNYFFGDIVLGKLLKYLVLAFFATPGQFI